jgi:hypothetical protein
VVAAATSGYLLLSVMKSCNMKASTGSWTVMGGTIWFMWKLIVYRSDMQIKYGEQNGLRQLLCDNEPQIRSTLDSVMGGVTYSVIHVVQPWCRTVRTAMWTDGDVSLKRYCIWLASNTVPGSQTILLLTLKQYCFWLSNNTASDSQAILFLTVK